MRSVHSPFGSEEDEVFSTEKLRILAYLYIPDDASYDEAMGWLVSRLTASMSRADRHAVCDLHLKDNILKKWRTDRRERDLLIRNLADQEILPT